MAKSLSPMTFRVSPDERRRIAADARLAGLTVGSYVRSRLLDVPQTTAMYRNGQTRRLVRHLIGQIGRVGNNMNQIALKLNSGIAMAQIDGGLHHEGITALKDMRALLIQQLLHETC